MAVTLAVLAEKFDCRLTGDPDATVDRVATLAGATSGAISFFANPHFRDQLRATGATAVIVPEDAVGDCPVAGLVTANPYATYARVAAFLVPPAPAVAGVDPAACVASAAVVAASAEIAAGVVIGPDARIGERVVIGAGTVIGAGVRIGADTRIAPRVSVLDGVRIGERCIIHSGAVIGADGFGFAPDAGTWVKVPQVGSVIIGNDVEIGANTTIDRGTIDPTVIEDGVKLDNLVQIAHNARIGAHTVMAAMSGVAGSTRVGRRCAIGGGAVTINHLTICDDVLITFRSVVTKSITKPGTYSGSLPAEEASQWRRNAARFRSLDRLADRLRTLEAALRRLHGKDEREEND